ncbi:MAG: hypothetical protein ACJ8AI_00060, partial [Rhodopila sp.]
MKGPHHAGRRERWQQRDGFFLRQEAEKNDTPSRPPEKKIILNSVAPLANFRKISSLRMSFGARACFRVLRFDGFSR